MFRTQATTETANSSFGMSNFLGLGKKEEIDCRFGSRLDAISEELAARLPQRGHIRHSG